jgi:hypothetical protein
MALATGSRRLNGVLIEESQKTKTEDQRRRIPLEAGPPESVADEG